MREEIADLERRLEHLRRVVLDRKRNERQIAGALVNAIHAHGPITIANRASAAKRIESALREEMKRRANGELTGSGR